MKYVQYVVLKCSFQDENLSVMQDKTNSRKGRDDNRIQDMEEESSDEDNDIPDKRSMSPLIQPPLPPAPDKVLVKKYDPKQSKKLLFFHVHSCFFYYLKNEFNLIKRICNCDLNLRTNESFGRKTLDQVYDLYA